METALYGAVALYVSSKVMDTVLYGLNASKVAYIISNHWQKTVSYTHLDVYKRQVTTFLSEMALFLTKKQGSAGDACSRGGDML